MNKLFENFIHYIFLIFSQNRHPISCPFNFESSLLFYFLITIKLYWCKLYLLRCVTFHCYIFYLPKATTLKKTDSHSSCQTQRAEGNLGLPSLSNLRIFFILRACANLEPVVTITGVHMGNFPEVSSKCFHVVIHPTPSSSYNLCTLLLTMNLESWEALV